MRWEPKFGGWVLRVSFIEPCSGYRFAGLVYPLAKGRWLAEVFDRDLAEAFDSEREARKFVEERI